MSKNLFENPKMLPKPIKTILKRYNDLAIKKGIEYTYLWI